ncbi:MAG: extracellular solute-binding protein [Candidatus Omnitrophota bacterium]
MRKFFVGVCAVLIVVTIVGCAQKQSSPNKIVVWHWMTDRDETFKKLANQYKEQTGIEVEFQLFAPSDSYSQKVIAAAQANVLPDIYGILDKKAIVADFIKAGLVEDLTAAMGADNSVWQKSFFDKALADKSFEAGNIYGVKPGIYGAPIDVTNEQMLYNKKLLAKAGITNPPKTYAEFIKDVKELKRVGIAPFVAGWGELWLIDCFASNYAFNIMGEEKVLATFKAKVKYTDPDWIKVFNIFADLRDKGVLVDGIVTKGNKDAEQDFALERVAFTFNGSWCVNVYLDMNHKLEYGVIPPPPISNVHPLKIWGGAGSSFVVNASSTHKDQAFAFLKWLTAKDQQILLAKETNNLPANREAMMGIPPVLEAFVKGMENSTHPTIWSINEDPLVSEAFDKGIQAIIIGEKTPQQIAKEAQVVKDRQMAKGKAP